MDQLYLVGAAQALFFAVMLGAKRQRSRADVWLMAFFCLLMLSLTFAATYQHAWYLNLPWMMLVVALVPLFYGPVIYFYLRERLELPLPPRWWGHGLPVLLFYVLLIPGYLDSTLMAKTFTHRFIDLPLMMNLGMILLFASAPVYFVLTIRLYLKNGIRSGKTWLVLMVGGAIILWGVEFGRVIYSNYLSQTLPVQLNHVTKGAYAFFVFVLGFMGLRQRHIVVDEERGRSGRKNRPVANYISSEAAKLIAYLETEKPYLNPNLKVVDVAQALQMPPHTLSALINDHFGMTFLSLVNRYRVEMAKNMLIERRHANLTILAVAYDCGFNAKSSFNRVFKEHTGMTPSMFIKMVTIG